MHPISLPFLTKRILLLLAAMALAFTHQDPAYHGVFIAAAAALFVYVVVGVARHVVHVNRKHRHLGMLAITGVNCLAIAFAVLFLDSTLVLVSFLLVVAVTFVYIAVRD